MDREARIAKRKADDAMRGKLLALDRQDGGKRTYFWTIEQEGLEMARGRPRKASTQATALMEALAFVKAGATKDTDFYQQHVRLKDKWAVSFDGQIAAGFPIVEELDCCPHLGKLTRAIGACGSSLAISETATGRLSVKGEKLNAVVPCLPWDEMPAVEPDANHYPVDDKLKDVFKACGAFASEAGEQVFQASLLLEAYQCSATNGFAMLQAWHGHNLPPSIVVPKLFAAEVVKIDKKIVGFGFSWNLEKTIVSSFTLWFENGAWLKTQCYFDRWPEIGNIINQATCPVEPPKDLFVAVEAVADFEDERFVIFDTDVVKTHLSDEIGAQYAVPGLMGGKRFNAKHLGLIKQFAKTIDIATYSDRMFFYGEGVRGVVMAATPPAGSVDPQPTPAAPPAGSVDPQPTPAAPPAAPPAAAWPTFAPGADQDEEDE
jgi:hypothetical protein